MTRLIVGPFNRVEGDLEVTLETAEGQVTGARVNAPMYRGFEQILEGKTPGDALVIAPRICGICSVSQSVAASRALADAMGLVPAPNGRLAANLVSAAENLSDHLSHFYLFFMPDFTRDIYGDRSWYEEAVQRFAAVKGAASKDFLPARNRLLHVVGILAGKWPHSLAIQPGGTTKAVDQGERVRLLAVLSETRRFLERVVFGDDLETVLALETPEALTAWSEEKPHSDFSRFLAMSRDLRLSELGKTPGRLMSYGAYPDEGALWLSGGLWEGGAVKSLDLNEVSEDPASAWLSGGVGHPFDSDTLPDAEKDGAYSWCKAPRLQGGVVEVGALARQAIAGNALAQKLLHEDGSTVHGRVVARLIEAARLIVQMGRWVDEFRLKDELCVHGEMPDEVQALGTTEAARGSLGHWMVLKGGVIHRYQIVAPTTWNFSPRDASGTPGPLEQALVGAPVREGEASPVAVQHIVRSFDPCMVCTVH